MLKVYNTLSRSKEIFEPLRDHEVSMYVCGPTVYHGAHIGHAMSFIIFDMIRRYLEYKGYHVRHVQNFTDVDDKIIVRAHDLGQTWNQLTEFYIDEFLDEMDRLNIQRAHVYPRASREIPEIIQLIDILIEKSFAYVIDGDVYFKVLADADYGKLSHRRLDEMLAGARVAVDERKQHPMDFALWKSSKPGEPFWDSPWGPGRPGWHIECSAMTVHHLGAQIDIHGGGADLIFPHHENEAAQSENGLGVRPFVKYWLHNGLLQLGGEKMSKSVGNLITIKEFLAENDPNVLRYYILSSQYRHPLTYSAESVSAAERGVSRFYAALRPTRRTATVTDGGHALLSDAQQSKIVFEEVMDDDFNTALALGALGGLAKAINAVGDAGAADADLLAAKDILRTLLGVLGFRIEDDARLRAGNSREAMPFIELLLNIRSELRKRNEWRLSDEIRDRLLELGVQVEDGPDGANWRFGSR